MSNDDDGYGQKYHTGKECIEPGCHEPAGTAWGPYWCKQHDIERKERVSAALAQVAADLKRRATGGLNE
jgi:hypothetical protein